MALVKFSMPPSVIFDVFDPKNS